MSKATVTTEELLAAYKEVTEKNPGISDRKAFGIIASMKGLTTHAVYQRIHKYRKKHEKEEKPEKQSTKIKNIRPDTYIGNKTGFKYKPTGKGLIIQQTVKEDKVCAIQVLSIEDFLQELKDCKEIF